VQEEEAVTGAGDGDEGVGEGGEHTGESDEENSQNKSTAAADSGDAPAAAEPPTTAAEEGGENPQQAEGGEAGEAPREGEGEGEEAPVAQKVIMRWVTKKRTIQKRRCVASSPSIVVYTCGRGLGEWRVAGCRPDHCSYYT
jgi:hypothetical protein